MKYHLHIASQEEEIMKREPDTATTSSGTASDPSKDQVTVPVRYRRREFRLVDHGEYRYVLAYYRVRYMGKDGTIKETDVVDISDRSSRLPNPDVDLWREKQQRYRKAKRNELLSELLVTSVAVREQGDGTRSLVISAQSHVKPSSVGREALEPIAVVTDRWTCRRIRETRTQVHESKYGWILVMDIIGILHKRRQQGDSKKIILKHKGEEPQTLLDFQAAQR